MGGQDTNPAPLLVKAIDRVGMSGLRESPVSTIGNSSPVIGGKVKKRRGFSEAASRVRVVPLWSPFAKWIASGEESRHRPLDVSHSSKG